MLTLGKLSATPKAPTAGVVGAAAARAGVSDARRAKLSTVAPSEVAGETAAPADTETPRPPILTPTVADAPVSPDIEAGRAFACSK